MSTHLAKIGLVAGTLALAGCLLLGCNRKPSKSAPKPQGGTSPATAPGGGAGAGVAKPPVVEVDAQDAADAPRALPKSHELRGWVKSEPVRLLPVSDLDTVVLDTPRRAALSTFRIQRIARCAYQRDGTTAVVLFIEAGSPDDAFGVFSIMTTQPGTLRADGTLRAVETSDEAMVASGWQGSAFAQVRFINAAGKLPLPEECEGLLASVLFNVPSAEAPWLLRAIQSEKVEMAKLWVVRSSAALAASRNPVLLRIDSATIDARLGLKGDVLLTVAAVQVAPGEPANLVWLASYPQAADARAAGERYQQALESATASLDVNTFVGEPNGPFLAGSWTADQESIQRLLPRLGKILHD